MSGFECVGGVLILWPLVVNCIQLYKAARNGQGWDLLLDEFRTEEIIYVECVRHLLSADTTEADLLQLTSREAPNQHLWENPALHKCLYNRLGHEKSPMVLKTLQEMDKLLTTLSEKFRSHENANVSTLCLPQVMVFSLMRSQGKL
jgi:hypothetical protein